MFTPEESLLLKQSASPRFPGRQARLNWNVAPIESAAAGSLVPETTRLVEETLGGFNRPQPINPNTNLIDALNSGIQQSNVAQVYQPDETTYRLLNVDAPITQTVKAVLPMNQRYNTFAEQAGMSEGTPMQKLDAVAQGLRTTTTRNNMQDNIAIRRLQTGDRVLFYDDKTGQAIYATTNGSNPIDPNIFTGTPEQSREARIAYAAREGGTLQYANQTLLGSPNPKIIPLDKPFSVNDNSYVRQGLSGNSTILNYEPQGDLIPIRNLPTNIKDKINQQANQGSARYDQTDGLNQFYNDSVSFQSNPIQGLTGGALPFHSSIIDEPMYSPEVLAGMGYLKNEDRGLTKINWQNRQGGAVPGVWSADKSFTPFTGNQLNLVDTYTTNPIYTSNGEKFKTSYNVKPITQNIEASGLPQNSNMTGLNSTLYNIDRVTKEQLGKTLDSIEVYNKAPGPGLEQILPDIQANAQYYRGKYAEETPFEEHYSLAKAGAPSQTTNMQFQDMYGMQPNTLEDYVGHTTAFDERGFPVDLYGNESLLPKLVSATTPASFFLSNTPQHAVEDINRTLLRPKTYTEVPEDRYSVTPFGMYNGEEPALGRLPLGVQVNNGSVPTSFNKDGSNTYMASRGRLIAGNLSNGSRGQGEGGFASLVGFQVPNPPGTNILRVLPPNDPRTESALSKQIQASQASVITPEDRSSSFNLNYSSSLGGMFPQSNLPVPVSGAFLPRDTANGLEFQPYNVDPRKLTDDLMNAHVQLDGAYHPLTPEATTVPFTLSQRQRSDINSERYGTRSIFDEHLQEPDDAYFLEKNKSSPLAFTDDFGNTNMEGITKTKKGLPEVYADPSISSTDIVGAIEAKKQELNRLKASINNRLYSPTARLLPDISMSPEEQRLEANQAIRPTRTRTVVDPEDGTSWVETVDPRASVSDIDKIFSSEDRPTVVQMQQRAVELHNSIQDATNTYKGLMNLETTPPMQIQSVTLRPGAAESASNTLANLGFNVQLNPVEDRIQINATGSLPIDLPRDAAKQMDLIRPTYSRPGAEVDPDIQAMYQQGIADRLSRSSLASVPITKTGSYSPVVTPQSFVPVISPNTTAGSLAFDAWNNRVDAVPTQISRVSDNPAVIRALPPGRDPSTNRSDIWEGSSSLMPIQISRISDNPAMIRALPPGRSEVVAPEETVEQLKARMKVEYMQQIMAARAAKGNVMSGVPSAAMPAVIPDPTAAPQYIPVQSVFTQAQQPPRQSMPWDSLMQNFSNPSDMDWRIPAAGSLYLGAAGISAYQRAQRLQQMQDQQQQ